MPSILTQYENVDFIAAKNFIYNGTEYKVGDPVPDAKSFGNLETLIRARRLVPVVDDYSKDAPLQFRRTVLTRELARRKLGLSESVESSEPVEQDLGSEEPVYLDRAPENTEPQDFFDPGEHTIDGVLDFVENHPDELLSVYALEEEGKARSTLLKKLDDLLNQQADEENEENIDV